MMKAIVMGGGCFWCTEAVFKMLKGVLSASPGYAGGEIENPTYEKVSSGKSGHAEVIKIEYDENILSLDKILTVFFATHDPTTVNRQGADIGEQYRSVIFYTDEIQKDICLEFIKKINDSSKYGKEIVTEVKPLEKFYSAENYHHDYYSKNEQAPYCQIVINPKLEKVQKEFGDLLKK